MGPHIGDSRHLQQTLHGTVLAVLPMKHREHHVDGMGNHPVPLETHQPLSPGRRNHRRAGPGAGTPGFGRKHGVILAGKIDPLALPGDAHGIDLIFFLIDVVQNGLGGAQGHLVLRADAAKEDAHAVFFHTVTSNQKMILEIREKSAIIMSAE